MSSPWQFGILKSAEGVDFFFHSVGQAAARARAEQQTKKANDVLYVLYSPATKLIKVGRTGNFKKRKLSLECAQGMTLDTLATFDRMGVHEKAIHEMLAEYQADGPGKEWFLAPASTILDKIEKFIAELPVQETVCNPRSAIVSPCHARLHQKKRPVPDMPEMVQGSKMQSLSEAYRRAGARMQELTTAYHLAEAINSPSLALLRTESQKLIDEVLTLLEPCFSDHGSQTDSESCSEF
jgi:hypothetical protein